MYQNLLPYMNIGIIIFYSNKALIYMFSLIYFTYIFNIHIYAYYMYQNLSSYRNVGIIIYIYLSIYSVGLQQTIGLFQLN